MSKFTYDTERYLEAVIWLKSIGEWERVSTSGFSTDGLSIVHSANAIYEKQQNEK